MHYGSEQPDFETLIIRLPTSSGVSERASKQMCAAQRARKASNAEQVHE